jgi:hypothetical protein
MKDPDLKYLMADLTHQCSEECISGHSHSQAVAALDRIALEP